MTTLATALASGQRETVHVPALHSLTVVAYANGSASVARLQSGAGNALSITPINPGETEVFGPNGTPATYEIKCIEAAVAYSVDAVDFPAASDSVEGFAVVGGDLKELYGAGAPAASVQASLSVNPTGDDNALTITAVTAGVGGNAIEIEYLDPGALSSPLSVSVNNKTISVSLETDGAGDIASTAAEVKAAVEVNAAAAAPVSVAIDAADTGVADDGSGVVTAMARASLANGAGVGAGVAGIGSRYTDTTYGVLYLNTGTKAVPVWSALATA